MEIRYQPDQPVRVSVLSTQQALEARIVSLNGRHAVLQLPQGVPPGTPLRIDFDDSMLLGQSGGCKAESGSFLVAVQVREAIPSLSDLARLVSAVMSEGRSTSVTSEQRSARTATAS